MLLLLFTFLSLGIFSIVLVVSYNSIIHHRNALGYAFSTLGALLRKKHDLIPPLVEVAQSYAKYEETVLSKLKGISENQFLLEAPSKELEEKEKELNLSLSLLAESFQRNTELMRNQSFLHLQKSMMEVEAQISAARRAYNAAAMEYNNTLEMFPGNFVAYISKFEKVDPMEIYTYDPKAY